MYQHMYTYSEFYVVITAMQTTIACSGYESTCAVCGYHRLWRMRKAFSEKVRFPLRGEGGEDSHTEVLEADTAPREDIWCECTIKGAHTSQLEGEEKTLLAGE